MRMDISKLKDALQAAIEAAPSVGHSSDLYICHESSLGEFVDKQESGWLRQKRESAPGPGGLVMRSRTGGFSGGSCWGGEAEPFTDEEGARAKFTLLEEFAERSMPDIPLRTFRRMADLVEEDYYSIREYYGNSTSYKVSFVPIAALAEFIEKEGLAVLSLDEAPGP